MANLTSKPSLAAGSTTAVDSVATMPLGSRMVDASGNEYIYIKGVTSGAANYVVAFDEAFASTLVVSGVVGRVGVLQAALTSGTYGWAQVYGSGTVVADAAVSDNALVYTSTAAGKVDDSSSSQTQLKGMVYRAAVTATGNVAVELSYPTATMA